MIKRINSILFVIGTIAFIGCDQDFAEINTNPYAISTEKIAESPPIQGQVLAQAQYTSMTGLHWRFQIAQNLFSDLWAGYYATTAQNFDSDRFSQVGRWADLAWKAFYEESAPQIKVLEDLTAETQNTVGSAIVKILKVNGYHRITDYWGPVPYSEFGNQELSVAYDLQQDIYRDLFRLLDEASSDLSGGGSVYGSSDRIYGGDGSKWRKLGESLRLRLAMRVRFVDPSLSKSEAEKAYNSGALITESSDNAFVAVDNNNRNPLETITDWGEFRMSATMEGILKGYNDPRIEAYFDPAIDGDSDGDGIPYEGLQNGQTRVTLGTSQNENHSDINVKYRDVAVGGENPPIPLFQASETHFLLAEAALAGYSVGGTAEQYYNSGISVSMKEHTSATDEAITAYTKSTSTPASFDGATPPTTDIPVVFDTSDNERALEQIITQKWIALFPNGWEAYAEARRTGYPKQYPRVASDNADVPVNEIPSRLVYVASEYSTNVDAINNAIGSAEIGGSDKNNVKLWWDKK